MATLSQNVKQATNDFDDIKSAIIEQGVEVPDGTPTSEYGNKIRQIEGGSAPANLDDFIAGRMQEVTTQLEIIPDFAFSAKGELTTVSIPEATYIGKYAFSSAPTAISGSSSIDGDDEGSEDEDDMHFNNKKLVTVNMPKVTNIEISAFQRDKNLEITQLPNTLLVIQNNAFDGCPKVQLTSLPSGLTYLGDGSLPEQENLGIEAIPETLLYLGSGYNRDTILSYFEQFVDAVTGYLDISQVPIHWLQMDISQSMLSYDSRFYRTNINPELNIPVGVTTLADLLFYNKVSFVTTINLPEGLLTIGNNVFNRCDRLRNLSLPEGLLAIGENAFYGCYQLTSLIIPESVTTIGYSAFRYCNQLTSLTIPNGITTLQDYAFYGCNNLTSLTLPTSLENIYSYCFYNCNHLTSVALPSTLKRIGYGAFYDCDQLTSLTLPTSLEYIENHAFYGCNSLTTVDMSAFDGSLIPQLYSPEVFYAYTHPEGFKFLFATQEARDAFANATNWSALANYFEVAE